MPAPVDSRATAPAAVLLAPGHRAKARWLAARAAAGPLPLHPLHPLLRQRQAPRQHRPRAAELTTMLECKGALLKRTN